MGCLLNTKFVLSLAAFCQVLNNGMGAPTASTGRYYWVRCKPNGTDTNCRTERGPLMDLSQKPDLPNRLSAPFVENIEAEQEEERPAAIHKEEEYGSEEEEEPVEWDGNQDLEEERELEKEQAKGQEQEQGDLGEEKGEEEEEEGEVQAVEKLSLFVDPEEGSAMAADGSADGPGFDGQLNQDLGYWIPVEEETAPPDEELREDHLIL